MMTVELCSCEWDCVYPCKGGATLAGAAAGSGWGRQGGVGLPGAASLRGFGGAGLRHDLQRVVVSAAECCCVT